MVLATGAETAHSLFEIAYANYFKPSKPYNDSRIQLKPELVIKAEDVQLNELVESDAILEEALMEGSLFGGLDLLSKLKNLPQKAEVKGRNQPQDI
jgi:hypothetical protein